MFHIIKSNKAISLESETKEVVWQDVMTKSVVTTEKDWRSQNFDFLSLKYSSPGQFLGISSSRRY